MQKQEYTKEAVLRHRIVDVRAVPSGYRPSNWIHHGPIFSVLVALDNGVDFLPGSDDIAVPSPYLPDDWPRPRDLPKHGLIGSIVLDVVIREYSQLYVILDSGLFLANVVDEQGPRLVIGLASDLKGYSFGADEYGAGYSPWRY